MLDGTTFDLFGDGDDVDLIEEVEFILGVKFEDAEVEQLFTFQDLIDLAESKLEPGEETTCLLMQAFRKVRDTGVLQKEKCRPSTKVTELIGSADPSADIAKLSQASGLDLNVSLSFAPLLGVSAWAWFHGSVGCAFVASLMVENAWPLLAWVVGVGAAQIYWPTELPRHINSLADLLRQSLPANYNRLRSRFGEGSVADRKAVIEAVCRDIACYSGPVTGETTFISNRRFFRG